MRRSKDDTARDFPRNDATSRFSYLKSDAQPGMPPGVIVSARVLLERRQDGGLRSPRCWVVRVVRLVPHDSQIIRAIPVRRLHDRRGVRGRRVPVTFRPTKQTAHRVFHGGGQVSATTAPTSSASSAAATLAGLVRRFVLDHFRSDRRSRCHFVTTCLRHVHSSHVVHLRRDIPHFFFFLFPFFSFLLSFWISPRQRYIWPTAPRFAAPRCTLFTEDSHCSRRAPVNRERARDDVSPTCSRSCISTIHRLSGTILQCSSPREPSIRGRLVRIVRLRSWSFENFEKSTRLRLSTERRRREITACILTLLSLSTLAVADRIAKRSERIRAGMNLYEGRCVARLAQQVENSRTCSSRVL